MATEIGHLTTGIPGVDAALSLASRLWTQYKALGATSAAAAAIVPRLASVLGLVNDVADRRVAPSMGAELAEVADALAAARDAADAAAPLAGTAGWLSRAYSGVGHFATAKTLGDALAIVNARLDRAIRWCRPRSAC